MLATLALLATLQSAPQQDSALKLTNAIASHSPLRLARKDAANPKILPGELFFLCFDIEGLKEGPDGEVLYSIGMELKNGEGKTLFKQEPQKATAYNSLGGGRVAGFARADIGTDTKPGKYKMIVTIIDRKAKDAVKTLEQDFEVLPKGLGMISLGLSYDPEGRMPAPALGTPGQAMFVNYFATGFTRDKDKKPHFVAEMQILDDSGKPVLGKPYTGTIKEAPAEQLMYPVQFVLGLNRSGNFKLQIKLTDKLTDQSVTETIDLKVVELK